MDCTSWCDVLCRWQVKTNCAKRSIFRCFVCVGLYPRKYFSVVCVWQVKVACTKRSTCWCFVCVIIIIMYIYHALINALSAHMIHINLNMIFYTHVKHSPTKTIYIKYCVAGESGLYQETYLLVFCVCGKWKWTVPREVPVGVLCV